jgi:type I restriction enzyme S subunit
MIEKKDLGNAFDFIRNGASIKQADNKTGYPITRIETIWNESIDTTRLGYADIFDKEIAKYEKYILQDGDILMTHINSPKHLGKCAIYKGFPKTLIHGMNLLCLRPKTTSTIPQYIFYFFNSKNFRELLPSISNQSVNQASFNVGKLKELQIPLPPLAEQQKIAAILDAADELRQKDKALVAKYDELTQALFLDMFGDPVSNPKGWEKEALKECTSKIGSGSTPRGGKESYQEEGISLIRSLNVYDNEFLYKNLAHISDEQANQLKNVTVEIDDVLFNITGASVCRCTIVPVDVLPARVNQHVSILRPSKEKLNPLYLSHLMISESTKKQLLRVGSAGGAIMEAITKEQLEKYFIPVPSLKLQNQFAERVNVIEEQKKIAQASALKSEELFNSLLQKAFNGELL